MACTRENLLSNTQKGEGIPNSVLLTMWFRCFSLFGQHPLKAYLVNHDYVIDTPVVGVWGVHNKKIIYRKESVKNIK